MITRINGSIYKARVWKLTSRLAHKFCRHPRVCDLGKAPCINCCYFWNFVYSLFTGR